jgi:hypothetical protein
LQAIFYAIDCPYHRRVAKPGIDQFSRYAGAANRFYTKYIKEAGFTRESESHRQLIVDIQKAIELKDKLAKNLTSTGTLNRITSFNSQTIGQAL